MAAKTIQEHWYFSSASDLEVLCDTLIGSRLKEISDHFAPINDKFYCNLLFFSMKKANTVLSTTVHYSDTGI